MSHLNLLTFNPNKHQDTDDEYEKSRKKTRHLELLRSLALPRDMDKPEAYAELGFTFFPNESLKSNASIPFPECITYNKLLMLAKIPDGWELNMRDPLSTMSYGQFYIQDEKGRPRVDVFISDTAANMCIIPPYRIVFRFTSANHLQACIVDCKDNIMEELGTIDRNTSQNSFLSLVNTGAIALEKYPTKFD